MNSLTTRLLDMLATSRLQVDADILAILEQSIAAIGNDICAYQEGGIEALSTAALARLRGTSESSVSSVKKAIANGNSEYESLDDWLVGVKQPKETKAKAKAKAQIAKMDKKELLDMLASMGIEVK